VKPHRGFSAVAVDHLAEFRAEGTLWVHDKTGAQVYHLAAEDRESLVAFVFPTPPDDDTGVAHILEHSVLCGSKNYPTKDPFLYLLKSSLNTFLNAMTYPDKTVYPVASVVPKDFMNLLGVYADAVYFPLLKAEAFRQEGHRLEWDDRGGLVRSGVVYNEMKGNYSSAEGVIGDLVQRALFDAGPYSHDSGGDPAHIPDLTYEAFRGFHARNYHPSRGLVFLYGDLDPAPVLRLLDKKYFRHFDRQPPASVIVPQARWSQPRTVRGVYPASAEEAAEKGTLALTWLVADAPDHDRVLALDLLSEILLGDAGVLQKSLLESGLGEDLSPVSGLFTEIRDVSFTVGLRGTSEDNTQAFEALVLGQLARWADNGFPRDLVDSVVASYEFSVREVRGGGMGLRYLSRATRGWLHGSTLGESLQFQPRLAALKARLDAGERVFETLVREALIANAHRATVVCVPDPELQKRHEEAAQETLAALRMKLAAADLEALKGDQNALKTFQETPDTRRAVASLPELRLADIPPKVDVSEVQWLQEPALLLGSHAAFTNGVLYLDLAFDLKGLGEEDYKLLPLLQRCLDGLGLEGLSWDLLAREIALNTGGLSFRANADESLADGALVGKFYVRMRMLEERRDAALNLLERVLTRTWWSNRSRLRELILEMKNDYQGALIPRGHVFASTRSAASLSLGGRVGELTGGLAQLDFLAALADADDAKLEATLESLRSLASWIWTSPGTEAMITGAEASLGTLGGLASALVGRLQSLPRPVRPAAALLPPSGPGPALVRLIPSTVGFVARSLRGTKMTEAGHAAELVLSHRLKTGFLWERIRMRGGAYGAFSMPNGLEGTFTFATYRDPNLTTSLDAFRESLLASRAEPLSGSELRNTIIGTVSNDLSPRSPADDGFLALQRRHLGISDDLRQAKRDALLRTTAKDVVAAAARLEGAFGEGQTFVLTGESIGRPGLDEGTWLEDRP
jgi:Zn-dependent M16 (insulinase) family peptidase